MPIHGHSHRGAAEADDVGVGAGSGSGMADLGRPVEIAAGLVGDHLRTVREDLPVRHGAFEEVHLLSTRVRLPFADLPAPVNEADDPGTGPRFRILGQPLV